MHARYLPLSSRLLFGLWFAAAVVSPSSAQCDYAWRPMVTEGATPFAALQVSTRWDPDGDGPLPEWLVIAGRLPWSPQPPTDRVIAWDGNEWHSLGPGFDGSVQALCVYRGELYAAGHFTHGPNELSCIARWDGNAWQPVGGGVGNLVFSMTVYQDELIVGGWFSTAGDIEVSCLARWNGSAWSDTGLSDAFMILSLTTFNGELVAAGLFGNLEAGIKRWNGQRWQRIGGDSDGQGLNAYFWMSVVGEELIVAGTITDIGGVPVDNIARWDGVSWSRLGSGLPATVDAVGEYNGVLVASSDDAVHVWNGAQWSLVGSANDPVRTINAYAGELVIAGEFTRVDALPAALIASWNGSRWAAPSPPTWQSGQEMSGMDRPVNSLLALNGALYAGGSFHLAGDQNARNIARWEGSRWNVLGSGTDDAVTHLFEFDGDLIAQGNFRTAGGVAVDQVARWDGSAWHPFLARLPLATSTPIVWNGEILMAGEIRSAGGASSYAIFLWDGTGWAPVLAPLPHAINQLATFAGGLIAGGVEGHTGYPPTTSAVRVYRWTADGWIELAGGLPSSPQYSDQLAGFLATPDRLFSFGTTYGHSADQRPWVAEWTGTGWSQIEGFASGGYPTPINLPHVDALAIYNGQLVAGGQFIIPGVPADGLAAWDGTAWHGFHSGHDGTSLPALTVFRGELWAGGDFHVIGDAFSPFMSRWTCPDNCACDGDGDGVPDAEDRCSGGDDTIDTDGDGVPDCADECPDDPQTSIAGACGCGVAAEDSDGDGFADCIDGCPDDPAKQWPGLCGCGIPDTDSDGDGVPDCFDNCPFAANPDQADADGDGVGNACDACPDDPHKSAPGACGCGVPDTDSDGDGTPDCLDGCPNDPLKTSLGACGCGIPDTDSDGDGIADCIDNCPTVPNPDQADSDGDSIGDACENPPSGGAGNGEPPPGTSSRLSGAGGGDPPPDVPGDSSAEPVTTPACGACGASASFGYAVMVPTYLALLRVRRRRSARISSASARQQTER